MLRTVRLYGELGKRYGRTHRFDVRTPAEALRALSANFPGFKKYVAEAHTSGVGFRVVNGGADLESVDEVHHPASGELKIVPEIIGSGATARILVGVALIAASFIPFFAVASPYMMSVGISLVLGGVIELLSPMPRAPEPPERPENLPSYTFNGPVNTTQQGQPVPVGYGRLIVGGAVISAGLSTQQIAAGYKRGKVEVVREYLAQNVMENFTPTQPLPGWSRREMYLRTINTFHWRYTYFEWGEIPA